MSSHRHILVKCNGLTLVTQLKVGVNVTTIVCYSYNTSDCLDRNECEEWGFCDQRCANTEGSYTCSCYPGYQLLDKARCVSPNSNNLLVFFAHDRSVYRMDSHGRNQQLIANTTTASGLDFHFSKNLLYWTDTKTKKVRVEFSLLRKYASYYYVYRYISIYMDRSANLVAAISLHTFTDFTS